MIVYAVIVLIVIALNEMLKRIGILPAKIIPISNIILSACIILAFKGLGIRESFVIGMFIGIIATGVYSSLKNILQWLRVFPPESHSR